MNKIGRKQIERCDSQRGISTALIDTSIQIERCKVKLKSLKVEEIIQNYKFTATSSYSKYEFNQAWLKRLNYIYNLSHEADSIAELLAIIQQRLGANSKLSRQLNTCIDALATTLEKLGEKNIPIAKFRSHIRVALLGAHDWWIRSVTHEFNGTRCVRAMIKPERASDGTKIKFTIPNCNKKDIKCEIHVFFEREKMAFMAVLAEIENDGSSDELMRAANELRIAKKDPKHLCNNKVCRKMGDILISIDGKGLDTFIANNNKEWGVLAKVFKRELINPVRD